MGKIREKSQRASRRRTGRDTVEISHRPCSKRAFLVAELVKNSPAMWETWVQPLDWKDPLEREWLVFWPGESHGPYNPWGQRVHRTE